MGVDEERWPQSALQPAPFDLDDDLERNGKVVIEREELLEMQAKVAAWEELHENGNHFDPPYDAQLIRNMRQLLRKQRRRLSPKNDETDHG